MLMVVTMFAATLCMVALAAHEARAKLAPAMPAGAAWAAMSSTTDGGGEDGGGDDEREQVNVDAPVGRAPLTPDQEAARDAICGPKLQRSVRHWLERLGIPLRDRDDLAHDATEAALRALHTFDPRRARPERWFNAIVVHVASHYNDRAMRWREELRSDTGESEDSEPRADAIIEADQEHDVAAQILRGALATLPEREAAVVIGHDLAGLGMDEIAADLAAPVSTLYRARRRAFAALLRALRPLRT